MHEGAEDLTLVTGELIWDAWHTGLQAKRACQFCQWPRMCTDPPDVAQILCSTHRLRPLAFRLENFGRIAYPPISSTESQGAGVGGQRPPRRGE